MKIARFRFPGLAVGASVLASLTYMGYAAVNSSSFAQGAGGPVEQQEAAPDEAGRAPSAGAQDGEPEQGKTPDADRPKSKAEKNKDGGEPAGDPRDKAKSEGGKQKQPNQKQQDQAEPKADPRDRKQPEADKANAEADKENRRAAQRAKAEAEKAKADADNAKADADKKNDAAAAKAKADADKQNELNAQRAKAEADKAKAAADDAKAEVDRQKNDAKAKADSDKARIEADQQKKLDDQKSKSEAAKGAAEADKQKQLDAEKAKADADKVKSDADAQKRLDADNAKADADKAQVEADKAKAEAAKGDAAPKTDADVTPPTPDRGNAEADKQTPPTPPPAVAEREKRDGGQGRQRDGARVPARAEPANEAKAVEQLQQDRAKADDEFQKAKLQAEQPAAQGAPEAASANRERRREGGDGKFEELRKQRRERVEEGGRRAIIEEPDKRVIILEKDRAIVRHDETRRFGRSGQEPRRERQKDGTTLSIFVSFDGAEILTVEDEFGHVLRRSRRGRDGTEIVLIDNRRFYSSRPNRRYSDAYVDLAPPVLRIPREKYVVEYDDASEEDVFEALSAPPVERLERGYAMEEVRESRWLRERMRRVDLNAINFAFASWEVEESQYPKLENVAEAIKRVLNKNRDEVFLIEGHTDAVGSDVDNLSLSDRRAEAVAIILSDTFRVPPENLTTQGYGEQYLKVQTDAPSLANRRVAVRRITPLLSRAD